jgi:hypothetical protein
MGTDTTIGGIILIDNIHVLKFSLPLKVNRESAYAAQMPTKTDKKTAPMTIMTELMTLDVTGLTDPADSSRKNAPVRSSFSGFIVHGAKAFW